MDNRIILATYNLTKRFKKIVAVSKLNLTIRRGDIFGFLGPNGAGKSTAIRMILGLIKPTAGKVELFNKTLSADRKIILQNVGALVEKPSFYNYLSAYQNLKIFAALSGGNVHQDIDRVLEIVDLRDRAHDRVKTFSQGMKQRLGIAQALLGNPELIILDEPTTGLDPQGMKEIRQLITQLAKQGLTVFLSSHLLHEVEQICNRMAIINKGELIVQGEVDRLLNSGIDTIIVTVDQLQEAAALLSRQNWIKSVDINAKSLRITTTPQRIPEVNKLLVTAGFKVFAIKPQRTLEDYFLSLIGN